MMDHPLAPKEIVQPEDINAEGLISAPKYSQEWPHYTGLLWAPGVGELSSGLEINGVQAGEFAARLRHQW
jgi:hypothetical protein